MLVAAITMVLSIGIGAPAGYAMSRFDFPGKEVFRFLVLMTHAFPLPLLALPLAVMFIRTSLDDTAFGLALVHTTLALLLWRGPAWLVVNYRIADGLAAAGETVVARGIGGSSLKLIAQSGFAEYYDPHTSQPLGGGRFTWTAAMVLEFLMHSEAR